jgi:hypothetical protein
LIINDIFGFGRGEILLSKQTKKAALERGFYR